MFLIRERAYSKDKTGLKRLSPTQLFNQLDACLREIFSADESIKPSAILLATDAIRTAYKNTSLANSTDKLSVNRYSNKDGSAVVLCSPVNDFLPKDGDLPNLVRGQIRDALTCYVSLRDDGTISPNDRFFIPLCQIDGGRQHFVLVTVLNDTITFVDSKSSGGSFLYPTTPFMSGLKKLANESFYQLTVEKPIFTGHQTVMNEVLCGHYVMSYVIQLSQPDVQDPKAAISKFLEDRLAQDDYTQRVDTENGFIMLDPEASNATSNDNPDDTAATSSTSALDTFEVEDASTLSPLRKSY